MLEHVWRRACRTQATAVLIATDDDRIFQTAKAFGAHVEMTATSHASGTDRLAEVVTRHGWRDDDIVVNVQGDEPLIPPPAIEQVASLLEAQPQAAIATLCETQTSREQLCNPHVVKVVCDASGYALYFSRAPIPWEQDACVEQESGTASVPKRPVWHRHVGLYAYRAGFLREFALLPPSHLELAENLEQLRALFHGRRIAVAIACEAVPVGVDTEEDLVAMRGLLGAPSTPAKRQ